jgi:hypothetical protein
MGILSHDLADHQEHCSVAMSVIQDRRKDKRVPGGLRLHQYVNLYLNARNKMLFKLRTMHDQLCVLRVSCDVLDLKDAVIADMNASSDWVRFARSPEGLEHVDAALLFANSWVHPDQREYWRHGAVMCAEVLVPNSVDAKYLTGGYVSGPTSLQACQMLGTNTPYDINTNIFFLG